MRDDGKIHTKHRLLSKKVNLAAGDQPYEKKPFFQFPAGIKCFHRNLTGFQVQQKPLKASGELSGSRWALFVETISVNGSTCFASVIAF